MNRAHGFTLVEMLISLSVVGICFAATLPLLSAQQKVWKNETAVREEFETLSSALRWLSRDLQAAGYGWAGHPVTAMERGEISYVIPVRNPGLTAVGRTDLHLVSAYAKEGDLMYRIRKWDSGENGWTQGSSHKLASNLSDISFWALSAEGAPTTIPQEITSVGIRLRGFRSGDHRAHVSLRNGRLPPEDEQ